MDRSGDWVMDVLDLIKMVREVSEQGVGDFSKVRTSVLVSHAGP